MNDETAPPSEEDGAVVRSHMGIDRGDGIDPWEGLPSRAIYWTLATASATCGIAILVLTIWFTP